ncbi:MAG TPA: ABC transporter ATP-binding protein [Syntrophomonadaceae bacterium]|nr:ABC transporter ATP-binding protein [Syntrophomonadaceae bacterium]
MPEQPKEVAGIRPAPVFPGRGGPGGRPHFLRGPVVKPKDTGKTLYRLWRYLRHRRLELAAVLLLVLTGSALNLVNPFLIGRAIDGYIIPGNFRGLLHISLLMLAVYLGGAFSTWLQFYLMIGVAQETVREIRKDLFNHLQVLPLRFFDSNPRGDLMSRLTNDVDNISNTLSNSTIQILSSILTLAGTLAMMIWLSPLMTLLSLATVPVMLLLTGKIAQKTLLHFTEQQKFLGELNGLIEETISGQRVVKVFGREQKQIEKFTTCNTLLRQAGIRALAYSGVIPPLMNVLNNINFAIIAAAGGWLAVKGVVTVGIIASFINYSRQFGRPLNELANQFNLLQSAIAGAERVFEVMDEPPEAEDPPGAPALQNTPGAVEFRSVNFSYKKGTPVLKDINLEVKPGQTIALVGPTGAGKTTIVNLLTRFYDIDSGLITIDGLDIRRVQRNSLRSRLGIVLQDTYLFSDTVRENIRYGRLTATDAEVEEAARLANAEHFILRLPQGYDTVITDGGANLSQGQRQLLAIARAILADPAILILDEATSNVDTRTEMHIQEAMLKLMQGRTTFVIAHRLSTIRDADLIVVINNGEIVERGSHEELLQARGFYYDLYKNLYTHRYVEQAS